uniref:Uncharacterized protein n=1 Tax=Mycena chlorophos TaxID=658473 RepID=A0ABQ0LYB5_MYCCL|nr:predicted protein [Mycena chlorophos]
MSSNRITCASSPAPSRQGAFDTPRNELKLTFRQTCATSISKGNLEFATIKTLSHLTILYCRSIDPLLLQPVYYIILDPSHIRNVDWENMQAVSAIRRRVAAIISTLRVVLDPMGLGKLPAQAASEIWDRIWKWAQFIEQYNEVLSLDTLEIWVSAGEKVAGL